MIGKNKNEPSLFQMVDIDSLVPENHRLRTIDAVLDLSFVREVLAECYVEDWGRPSIDPELAVRMMILGTLYDLSDRRLCDEIRMHAGFRWFCRLDFHDSVPDHSTLSRLRNERWVNSDLFGRFFEEVLGQCVSEGMVGGRHVSVDGTQIRADASIKSLERRVEERDDGDIGSPAEVTESDRPSLVEQPKEQRSTGQWEGRGEQYTNCTHESKTDPDARLYRKGSTKEVYSKVVDGDEKGVS